MSVHLTWSGCTDLRRDLKSGNANIGAAVTVAIDNRLFPSTATESFANVAIHPPQPGEDTWPITMMSYFYVRKDLTSLGATGTLLKVQTARLFTLSLRRHLSEGARVPQNMRKLAYSLPMLAVW